MPTGDVPEFVVNDEEEQPLTFVPNNDHAAGGQQKFQYFYSAGEIKHLPKDFIFPHMGLCALVLNWFCGNPSKCVMPLKFICPVDLKDSRALKTEV